MRKPPHRLRPRCPARPGAAPAHAAGAEGSGMVDMPTGLFSLRWTMATNRARIGLVGLGYIGRYVYEQISARPELGLEIAFVHEQAAERLAGLPDRESTR